MLLREAKKNLNRQALLGFPAQPISSRSRWLSGLLECSCQKVSTELQRASGWLATRGSGGRWCVQREQRRSMCLPTYLPALCWLSSVSFDVTSTSVPLSD